jgi:acyl carrier protein
MDIKAEVRQYVAKKFLADGQDFALEDTTPLVTGGIIDSIGMVGLIAFVEGRFGVDFMPREVDVHNFDTVERIERLVLNKLGNVPSVSRQDRGGGNV